MMFTTNHLPDDCLELVSRELITTTPIFRRHCDIVRDALSLLCAAKSTHSLARLMIDKIDKIDKIDMSDMSPKITAVPSLESHTCPQLKSECRRLALPVSGSKAILMIRLRSHRQTVSTLRSWTIKVAHSERNVRVGERLTRNDIIELLGILPTEHTFKMRLSDLAKTALELHGSISSCKRAGCDIMSRLEAEKTARRSQLVEELQKRGCVLRRDSYLCMKFIDDNEGDVCDVADTMQEMKFYFERTTYQSIYRELGSDSYHSDYWSRREAYREGIEEDEYDEYVEDRREADRHERTQVAKMLALTEWVRRTKQKCELVCVSDFESYLETHPIPHSLVNSVVSIFRETLNVVKKRSVV